SLGARHINNALISLKDDILSRDHVRVIHITGEKLYDEVCEALSLSKDEATRWQIFPYQDHMAEVLAAADCVIARSGATSLAEIAARNVPALLIPFPYATDDHQTKNASSMVARGAAYMLSDDSLDSPQFKEYVCTLLDSEDVRSEMRNAAAACYIPDSAKLLADAIEVESNI
ncbi:MAG: undecaprenyldiphospho-muramoylpentapeptide beta-N-acetylglucosaminyltransferase, partial [Eggerthellaceae bacterium]|nr:undecaprenyldiphospho-muramoylpentapeptide beta-N-acetylglucosaminyltransferase [Eggerthellaceae bacterium]